MKRIANVLIFPLLFSVMACSQPIKVILDTDMDSDIDDVAAIGLLHHFADLGEVEILATVSCSSDKKSIEVVDAINTYFNRPDIPVAVPNEDAPKHAWVLKSDVLSKEFPHDANADNSPSAVKTYRKILANQPDNTVVIISLGYLNNLKDLLLSEADEFSPLSGAELVAKKVSSYYCMGGSYPADEVPKEVKYGNFRPDPVSTAYVNQHWPTKMVYTGGGPFAKAIQHGNALKELPEGNIVRRAYELAKGDISENWGHHSADILTVWMAIRGTGDYFHETTFGYNEIDEYGANTWKTDQDQPNRSYISDLKEGMDYEEVAELFESYLLKLDGNSNNVD